MFFSVGAVSLPEADYQPAAGVSPLHSCLCSIVTTSTCVKVRDKVMKIQIRTNQQLFFPLEIQISKVFRFALSGRGCHRNVAACVLTDAALLSVV